jgi:hypothetical protein
MERTGMDVEAEVLVADDRSHMEYLQSQPCPDYEP